MRKVYEVSQALEIEGDAADCYNLLCDFESYPSWFHYVKAVKILKRDELDIPLRVDFTCDIAIKGGIQKKGIKVVNEYAYDQINKKLIYKVVGGDVKQGEGYYQFRQLNSGKTLAVFYVKIDFGIIIPAKLISFMIDTLMKGVLVMIKNGVEKKTPAS